MDHASDRLVRYSLHGGAGAAGAETEGPMDDDRAATTRADAPGDPAGEPVIDDAAAGDDEAIEVAGGVATAGRRMLTEDWAATILGLVLLVLVLAGVIGKGMVP
jgi:hypothetical protein